MVEARLLLLVALSLPYFDHMKNTFSCEGTAMSHHISEMTEKDLRVLRNMAATGTNQRSFNYERSTLLAVFTSK